MAETQMAAPAPKKRRSWLRSFGWAAGILVVLVVVLYFVGTSAAFLKGFILPQVSTAMGAKVTVSDASISPFSQVILRNLKVETTGTEPLVAVPEVRLRYNLMAMMQGNIEVDEIAVVSPTLVLVQNPDGTSNLDPILKAQQAKPVRKPAPKPAAPSKPMQVNLKKMSITGVTLRTVKLYLGGTKDVAEIWNLDANLDNVKNGATGKFTVGAAINVDNHPPAPQPSAVLQAKLNANYSFSLSPDLKPASVTGNSHLEVTRAEGALAQAATLTGDVDCDLSPTEIKQVAMHLQKGSVSLGKVRLSGPFDMEKSEGNLRLELLDVDKQLLNLASAGSGLDFGPTSVSSTNSIQLTKGGATVALGGRFSLNHLQLTRAGQTTPTVDLRADYSLSADKAQSTLTLARLTLNASQNGSAIVNGGLTSPMQVSWGNAANAVGDSTLNLEVTRLDLADWKAFLGNVAPAGVLSAKTTMVSQQGGKQLSFDVASDLKNFTVGSGGDQVTALDITFKMNGKMADMKQLDLKGFQLGVEKQGQSMVSVSGAGTADHLTQAVDLQVNAQLHLPQTAQALPNAGVGVSSGTAEFKAHLAEKQHVGTITGGFSLADFSAQCGNSKFQRFAVNADFDAGFGPQQVQLRSLAGKLMSGTAPGGMFSAQGTFDPVTMAAQFTVKLADFNQDGLRPFLQAALGDKQLTSVAVNANASGQYTPGGPASVKADFQMTKLVVKDPEGKIPSMPLELGAQLDASLNNQVADIRQCRLSLTPTARATNQVQLTGHVDMTKTNAIQGNLKLTADSLDATTYFDLFAAQKQPAEATPSPTGSHPAATSPAPSGPEQEAAAVVLPFRNFTAEAAIRRFYSHELEIADLLAKVKIDGGHVVLDPAKLTLNGAPINSMVDADLGVPGYKYAMTFSAQAVPLPPIVNSFQPDRKGQVGGTFTAQAKVSGAGTTGASLQKNLAGQFNMNSTNLNLSVVNVKSPLLRTVINVVSVIPDLIRNTGGALSSLLGAPGSTGGLADELSRSPIDATAVRVTMGSGKVALDQAMVRSSAFEADAKGTVTLASVLTNSALNIPVSVSLSRPIAARLNLVPPNTLTNAAYVALPDFFTLTGTVGKPDKKIDKLALLSITTQSVTGMLPGLDKNMNGVVEGVRGLLGGGSNTSISAATNKAPKQSQVNEIMNGVNSLFGPKKK